MSYLPLIIAGVYVAVAVIFSRLVHAEFKKLAKAQGVASWGVIGVLAVGILSLVWPVTIAVSVLTGYVTQGGKRD